MEHKDIKSTWPQKHKKFFALLGIVLILAAAFSAIVVGWLIIKLIMMGIRRGIDWISTTSSKMDAVVIVALITGCVSILGVIISSIVAKMLEFRRSRREYLAKKREAPYGEFVDMVYKIQKNSKKPGSYNEEQMQEDILKFSRQMTLWGSPRVVDKWIQFRENGANPDFAQKNLFVIEDILNDMRKDLGQRRVKKGNLLGFFVNDIKKAMKRK